MIGGAKGSGPSLLSHGRQSVTPLAVSRLHLFPLLILGVVLTGCALRIVAAERLTPHVDEAASVLAAHAVAERGVPVLPSGTVYFQGATLSYLLAPFVWLGAGGLEDLVLLRAVSVIAGTLAVYLGYRLAIALTRDERVGIVAALFIAMDPLSVHWSGHVRMYGLLQALTIGLVWLLVRAVHKPTAGVVASLALVFWISIFTHIETALLWPAMAIMTLVVWRSLTRQYRWNLVIGLAVSAMAPVALVVLNNVLGSASVGGKTASPSPWVSFVGDHLLAPLALVSNLVEDFNWEPVLRASNAIWYVPGLTVAVGTLVAARWWLFSGNAEPYRQERLAVNTVLTCYWIPMVGVGLFSVAPKERYLLHVHLLGYVLLALVAMDVARRKERSGEGSAAHGRIPSAVVITALILTMLGTGLTWRLVQPVVHADHVAATQYVAAHQQPDDIVIAALPAVADLVLDDRDRLYFLAGPEERPRAERLTRVEGDHLIDYWVGIEAIVSAEALETLLREHPGAWVVADDERLSESWAYAGAISDTLADLTVPVYEGDGGVVVLRVPPAGNAPAA
jgi:hypothetical protein